MKSFFSCFPRRKNKSSKSNHVLQEEKIIINNKPAEFNVNNINKQDENCVVEVNHAKCELETENEEIINIENERLRKEKEEKENEYQAALIVRMNNALLRIENVYKVLNNKYSGYYLPLVLTQFEGFHLIELRNYMSESEIMDSSFRRLSALVKELFDFHKRFLIMIQDSEFCNLTESLYGFRTTVIEINRMCLEDETYKDLFRLVADSILIFGWLCIFDRPAKFIQNNLDGYLINITRLLNDPRFVKQSNWLKSWAVVLKRFAFIVTKTFEAALMWGIDGPVPMDILKCLIECNYSRLEDPMQNIIKPKEKVIKTTAVDDISCETMTDLMDDLRSGRHKSRLRPVRQDPVLDSAPVADPTPQVVAPDNLITEDAAEDQPVAKLDYRLEGNLWIIENAHDQAYIEVPNKGSGNSVLIRNCHNSSIQIDGALSSLKLENSSSVNVIVDDITGLFDVRESTGIEFQVLGKIAKVTLNGVLKFRIFIPLSSATDLEMTSVRTSDVELYISKSAEGGLELDDFNKFVVETNCRSKISEGTIFSELF